MNIFAVTGKEELAVVYLADFGRNRSVEFVESLQPDLPRDKKWVLIVSTLYGCPVGCPICDAGTRYTGKLSKEELFTQIDFLVKKRFPSGRIPVEKFKIQFARMGEPSLNLNVLDVLKELPERYDAPGLMPSISTVAPKTADTFFKKLLELKEEYYGSGRFQLQFSIHTTDEKLRDRFIPIKKWDLRRIGEYGKQFFRRGDRKITLNFALAENMPVVLETMLEHFDPKIFLIKVTPVNPTGAAEKNGIVSYIKTDKSEAEYKIIDELDSAGYEVLLSIGALEENEIGSNCGQYVMRHQSRYRCN